VFSVNSGTKGSRVSVIEGEVHLNHADNERVLHGGEQATTNSAIAIIPVKDEIAWSRKAARYAETLAAFTSLNKELAGCSAGACAIQRTLLDLMPENTIVYAALPNLTSTIVESHRIMQERINQNAALREWWEKEEAAIVARMSIRSSAAFVIWRLPGRRNRSLSLDGRQGPASGSAGARGTQKLCRLPAVLSSNRLRSTQATPR